MSSEANKIDAIVITSHGSGSYTNIKVLKQGYPKLDSPSHVLIRVKAVGLNFAELMQRQGFYSPKVKPPYTPGFEASGIVEQVGDEVKNVKVGDHVIAYNSHNMWKEVVCVPAENTIPMPEKMTFEEGAAFVVNYLTAYQILYRLCGLKPGHKVLIHMAAGGVGVAATQICKAVPNVTVFGTASGGKHDKIRENGVDYPIDYNKVDFAEEVKKISPEGVDIILDALNGEATIKGYAILKPFGKICSFGAASLTNESGSMLSAIKTWWKSLSLNSIEIISHNKALSGYHLGYLLNKPECRDASAEDIKALLELFDKGAIKFFVDSTFKFSQIGEAMHRMHSRLNVGKIVLKPDCEFN